METPKKRKTEENKKKSRRKIPGDISRLIKGLWRRRKMMMSDEKDEEDIYYRTIKQK